MVIAMATAIIIIDFIDMCVDRMCAVAFSGCSLSGWRLPVPVCEQLWCLGTYC